MNSLTVSLFLIFLLASSVALTNLASAYEKENHYWLKMAIALNCGFTLDEARLISIGDFSIDDDPDTQPVRPGTGTDNPKWKWHALPTENPDVDKNQVSNGNQQIKQRQQELYDRAIKEKDTSMRLFKFGQYLHYQEDKWSHWSYTTGAGHAVQNVVPGMTSPDETHASPEFYRYMVFDSMVNLGKLAKSLGKDTKCVSDLVPLDTYHSAPEYGKDFPWFSPQEIKRTDSANFKKSIEKHLADWKKTGLINEVIKISDEKGDIGVTDSFVGHIAKETGVSKSHILKKYDYQNVDIDKNGNTKKLPDDLIKSLLVKPAKITATKPVSHDNKTSKVSTKISKADTKTKDEKVNQVNFVKKAYLITLWDQVISDKILKLSDFQIQELKKADSILAKSKTNDKKTSELKQRIVTASEATKKQAETISTIFKNSKNQAEFFKAFANKIDISKSDLDKIAKIPLSKLKESKKINNMEDFKKIKLDLAKIIDEEKKTRNDLMNNVIIPTPSGKSKTLHQIRQDDLKYNESTKYDLDLFLWKEFVKTSPPITDKTGEKVHSTVQEVPTLVIEDWDTFEFIVPNVPITGSVTDKTGEKVHSTVQEGLTLHIEDLTLKSTDPDDNNHIKLSPTTLESFDNSFTVFSFFDQIFDDWGLLTNDYAGNVEALMETQKSSKENQEKTIIKKDSAIPESKTSNTKPTLTLPKEIIREATGSDGTTVDFSISGFDKEDGSLTPVCTPASGSIFPIGTTAVRCMVTDSQNNSVSGSFTVTVRDTTPPTIDPIKPSEGTRDDSGVIIFYEATAHDLVDGNVLTQCNYPSGYKFPIGVTVLTCTADDSHGNHGSRSLQITVTKKESSQ